MKATDLILTGALGRLGVAFVLAALLWVGFFWVTG
jgi:hypothetical protein